jgi:TetR/AcrR family transcriptional repressor of uid operon
VKLDSTTTADAILQAARKAMAERGPERLTMSAVATRADISRPTLYRWFPTKSDLLAALVAYEETQFDIGLQVVIDAHRSPRRRLDAAVRYLVNYLDDSMMPDPIGADPAYSLQSLAKSLQPHVEILARLLGDALDEVPAVRARTLSREQAAEMFLRLAYSHYLVPHPDTEVLLAAVRDFAGLPRRHSPLLIG